MKLTIEARKKLPSKVFALKGRKYPIEDKANAINAKGRAKQQLDKGNLTESQYKTIVKKANKKLKKVI